MKPLIYLSIVLFFIACNSNKTEAPANDSTARAKNSIAPATKAEIYSGILPCADCEGIDVSVQLNNDATFIINSVYKGSRVDSLKSKYRQIGFWKMFGDTLNLTDANRILTRYIKTDTAIIQLDGDGKMITGPLAPMYVLHKN